MADLKVRLSNAYPEGGEEAFAAMLRAAALQRRQWPATGPVQTGEALSLESFARGAESFRPPLSAAEAEFAFRGMDSNRDGQMTQGEFLEALWSGAFLPSGVPPEEPGQALTTITSSRASSTPTTTLPLEVGIYAVTDAVVQDEGASVGDFMDRPYSLEECKDFCDKRAECTSFAYYNGDCHLKDRCVHARDPVDRNSPFRTYYKPCVPQAAAGDYEELGPGYCPHGYYAGGDPADAVSLAQCQARCSAEPQCEFISLHMKDTCSRYNIKAGDCADRPLGRQDHVTYRRVAGRGAARMREGVPGRVPATARAPATALAPATAEGPEELVPAEAPITMADFKARMLKAYASAVHAFQALGTNPSGLEDFARGATTFQPPLTFEQAKYAFRGLDTDHDDLLRSFEFFEVIECGHFFPTPQELEQLHGDPRAFRSMPLQRSRPSQQGGPPATSVLAIAFGLATCVFGVLLGFGLRMASKAGRAQAGRAKAEPRETYAALPYLAREAVSSRGSSCPSSQRELISL